MKEKKGLSMNDLHKFQMALSQVYKEDPCGVLPNALWKTVETLATLQCSLDVSLSREILDLRAWDQEGLRVLWNGARETDEAFHQIMTQSRFMIIHDDYFKQVDCDGYSVIKPFFRIMHDHESIPASTLSDGFYIKEADPERESQQMANLIGKCYRDLHPSPDAVKSWNNHLAFEQSLWIWIIDRSSDAPAALGIAELDGSVPEGSLEWIQVLPEYQGRGLGKALALELLQRLRGRANFTTVSGEVDNVANPERLYRSCGFTGRDVWWLLRK